MPRNPSRRPSGPSTHSRVCLALLSPSVNSDAGRQHFRDQLTSIRCEHRHWNPPPPLPQHSSIPAFRPSPVCALLPQIASRSTRRTLPRTWRAVVDGVVASCLERPAHKPRQRRHFSPRPHSAPSCRTCNFVRGSAKTQTRTRAHTNPPNPTTHRRVARAWPTTCSTSRMPCSPT